MCKYASSGLFSCNLCKDFKTDRYVKTIHSREKAIKVDINSEYFYHVLCRYNGNPKAGFRTSHYHCPVCPIEITRKDQIVSHLKSHKNIESSTVYTDLDKEQQKKIK